MAIQNATPEMGKHLRQVVDNALEEGQFESGIAMLDQLRSPDHKPSIIHILHLVFISLHSNSHDVRLDESGSDPVLDSAALLLQSPRKIVKQAKSALVLSPHAVLAAQNLLFAFISTNLPQDIAAALPHYPDTEARRQVTINGEGGAQFAFDYVDSPIYNQSAALRNARSVWDILKEGYTKRAMQVFGTPKVRKGKATSTRPLARDSSINLGTDVEEIRVVGDHSWVVLEWLVALFEKDADIARSQGMEKHSPLLLRQLPPPPLNTHTRWDASEPLKIVAFAIQQSDWRRQRIGLRLLNLLIDLAHAQYLNTSSLASTALAQFVSPSTGLHSRGSSPTTPPQELPTHTPFQALITLFTILSSTSAVLAFKITLCQKILQDIDGTATSSAPRPAPRPSNRSTANSNKGDNVNTFTPTSDRALVSALKRPTPRILPRPRMSTTTSTISPDINADSPHAVKSEVSVETNPSNDTDVTINLPTTPVTIQVPQPRLPLFAEVSQLVKAQGKNEGPNANIRSRAGRATQVQRTGQGSGRTATNVLLQIKYELLLACATLLVRTRGELEAQATELVSRPDIVDWTTSLSDGRMHELILVLFGPQTFSSSANEASDKSFYADSIKAIVGLPIDAT